MPVCQELQCVEYKWIKTPSLKFLVFFFSLVFQGPWQPTESIRRILLVAWAINNTGRKDRQQLCIDRLEKKIDNSLRAKKRPSACPLSPCGVATFPVSTVRRRQDILL